MSDRKLYDPEAIRARVLIPDLLAAKGWPLKKSADGWRGGCPVHQGDNREAFHVTRDGMHWHCFTNCQTGGDVISLARALDGTSFSEACKSLGGRADVVTAPIIHAPRPAPEPEPLPSLDDAKRSEMQRLAERLANDEQLCADIAGSRGWEPATISALAHTCALGWMDHHREGDGALCFLYPRSVKTRVLWKDGTGWRWHRPDNEKRVSWLWTGWAWNGCELWREDRLRGLLRTGAVVVEGEPDCITMIDAGANDTFNTVVSIPSATMGEKLRLRLPEVLRGLHVTLSPDDDEAGRKAADTLAALVTPTARTFTNLLTAA